MPELGVNIDHVATVRQARRTTEPDPVWAAVQAELGGADGITIHLREDRRHIQDRDVRVLRSTIASRLNLELACAEDVLRTACETGPEQVTLVPEKREEVTTEGGLDLLSQRDRVASATAQLQNSGIQVSLFIDPEIDQIQVAGELGVTAVELHTGAYAHALGDDRKRELEKLHQASEKVVQAGMTLHAGHGLTYQNVRPVAEIPHMHELNIGHSIIARALMVGMKDAVASMKQLVI